MNLVLATHVYPLNPRAPAEIPGNFLPPFVHLLVERGAQVDVLAPNRPGEKTADDNAPVTWFDWSGDGRNLGRFNPLNPLDAMRLFSLYRQGSHALQELIRRRRADAVLACWAVPSGALANEAWRKLGTPYAVWSLGTDIHTSARQPILRPFVKRALEGAALNFANSQTLADQVQRLSGRSCDLLATARPLPAAAPVELPHDRVNFLFAGRLEPVKGLDILLQAFAQLPLKNVRAHLYVAGDGSLKSALHSQAAALNVSASVTFLGYVSDEQLASYLSAVDAVVIPSRAEALPSVFTQAAQFGTPAVSTDVGDLGLLTRRYGLGLVVEPENVNALAAGLAAMALCEDRSVFRRRMPELTEYVDTGRAAEKLLTELDRVLSSGAKQSV